MSYETNKSQTLPSRQGKGLRTRHNSPSAVLCSAPPTNPPFFLLLRRVPSSHNSLGEYFYLLPFFSPSLRLTVALIYSSFNLFFSPFLSLCLWISVSVIHVNANKGENCTSVAEKRWCWFMTQRGNWLASWPDLRLEIYLIVRSKDLFKGHTLRPLFHL